MKTLSFLFSILMFTVLFVAPLAQTVFQDDISFVLQEFEDSNDVEEGELLKHEESQENFYCAIYDPQFYSLEEASVQLQIERTKHIFALNKMSVETPPPRFL